MDIMTQAPIIKGEWADPFILKDGEDYYLYPTKDSDGWVYEKFHVFHSKNLIDWDGPHLALDLNDVSWAHTKAWAPGITKYNGKYYMYFSAEAQIGVAVSDSPMGPFVDILGRPLITKDEYDCQSIDADLFIDDDNHPYLLWGQGKCWIVPLEKDMVTFKTDPILLSDQLYENCRKDPKVFDSGVYNEGPHLQKVNGKYLLTWSNYDTRDPRYQICFATSQHIYGPYEYPEDNRVTQPSDQFFGTGHASMTQYKNEWYLVYHRLIDKDRTLLRETCISKITFEGDKPVVDVNKTISNYRI
ncbi:family 43 glycosylhydrolase [Metabacillus halosaccharovorans]|uniref:family 43 glycosylhydrolase n=1 Tax=Metabacillus halosaccharovorans TaxID=930124 RepID=UPI00204216B7|nr:family 43 glycosylhydrolase [Metabacillus halosaccharovorans]MCM3440377.1 family 43 glycosylhydrolase [Metabacillus halosaccharovorans]